MGFFHPYYVLNWIFIFSFPIYNSLVKYFKIETLPRIDDPRCDQIFIILVFILIMKYVRSQTVEQALSNFFFLAKIGIFAFYVLINVQLAAIYLAGSLILFKTLRMPPYDGPTNAVEISNAEELKNLMKPGATPDKTSYCCVEFYANSIENCLTTQRMWAEFSIKYQTKLFKFARVNIMRNRELVGEHKINTREISNQLPTLIIFENGKEIRRYPPVPPEGQSYERIMTYNKKEITRFLGLEHFYAATRSA